MYFRISESLLNLKEMEAHLKEVLLLIATTQKLANLWAEHLGIEYYRPIVFFYGLGGKDALAISFFDQPLLDPYISPRLDIVK